MSQEVKHSRLRVGSIAVIGALLRALVNEARRDLVRLGDRRLDRHREVRQRLEPGGEEGDVAAFGEIPAGRGDAALA